MCADEGDELLCKHCQEEIPISPATTYEAGEGPEDDCPRARDASPKRP